MIFHKKGGTWSLSEALQVSQMGQITNSVKFYIPMKYISRFVSHWSLCSQKSCVFGAEEMIHKIKTPVSYSEEPSSIPSIHVIGLTTACHSRVIYRFPFALTCTYGHIYNQK